MFERYNEKARRVIFFARYEASQYGNRQIETEHLLLGLAREDRSLIARVGNGGVTAEMIRSEVEKFITIGKRISTSVEVPLSPDSKKILTAASEEAERYEDRFVGTKHLLLAMLSVENCHAARILAGRGVTKEAVRQIIASETGMSRSATSLPPAEMPEAIAKPSKPLPLKLAEEIVSAFLASFKAGRWKETFCHFAEHVRFIDAAGNRWAGPAELRVQFEKLFPPYANPDASFSVESVNRGPGGSAIANVLWKGVSTSGGASGATQRMTVMLGQDIGKWSVFFVQVTPVQISGE